MPVVEGFVLDAVLPEPLVVAAPDVVLNSLFTLEPVLRVLVISFVGATALLEFEKLPEVVECAIVLPDEAI